MRSAWGVACALALCAPAGAQSLQEETRRVYDDAASSTVAVRAMATLGERSGAGVVLTDDGLILTSYAIVPPGSTRIRVWFHGAHTAVGEFVGGSERDEVSLIRVHVDFPLRPIRFGSSEGTGIGTVVYTLGNANNAFINDDSPAFSMGVVSGQYSLAGTRSGATYVGPLFETTAAVNPGMAGGPLLNARGEMIAMITMNFSVHRWMGYAIPVDWVRHAAEQVRAATGTAANDVPPPEGEPWIGMEFEDTERGVRVASVAEGGPAAQAGLNVGDRIVALGRRPLLASAQLNAVVAQAAPGDSIGLRVANEAGEFDVRIAVGAAP